MKNWLIVLNVRSELDIDEYINMVTDRIVVALGKYYERGLYCADMKTSFCPYVGQIHSLYFNITAQTSQEALDFVGEWANEYYCQPPDMVHGINCIGEFDPSLLQQAMRG